MLLMNYENNHWLYSQMAQFTSKKTNPDRIRVRLTYSILKKLSNQRQGMLFFFDRFNVHR
ncbi:hypothetical protein CWM47_20105 [Spirosoma pollinicola]|uniref:Uncharacterized protein n=1 Tax=Spirosoma pollinicola TaxID=2057025 RepID=A0A2K8Z214_9BACT|nr:hypothetical protein CWM47_20105 [Spirosoma pollinicola]